MKCFLLPFFLLTVFCISCDSGSGKGKFVDEPLVLSTSGSFQQNQCGPDFYPCGPYGTRRYQTVRDVPFIAVNPAAIELSGGENLAWFHHFHALRKQGYKLLFVSLTTGWCTHCGAQMEITPQMVELFGSKSQEPRIAFLVVVVENHQLDPATVEYAAEYSSKYGMDETVVVTNDQGNAFFQFMTSVGYPFNFFIRLDTMTIVDYASSLETVPFYSGELERVLQSIQ